MASLSTEVPAITFNPAALNDKTKKILDVDKNKNNQILNVVVRGELVDKIQKELGLSLEGFTKTISDDKTEDMSSFRKHSIDTVLEILKEKEKRVARYDKYGMNNVWVFHSLLFNRGERKQISLAFLLCAI